MDFHVGGTWRLGMMCLDCALRYGSHASVILALEVGILSTIWRFSTVRHRYSSNEKLTDGKFLFETIGSFSLYRSVQKVLEKALRRKSFVRVVQRHRDEFPEDELQTRFRAVVSRRVSLREQLEKSSNLRYCSYSECTAPPSVKFLLCSQCGTACYCSRQCQKLHWNSWHRDYCEKVARRSAGKSY
ncbi:hypothetical protein BT96DRAFT_475093 [Gymnopus androsaceus JB14]|uniref:MYND-type domain-containing protein n=1 Tax=Gymnopus androsaceus JB14 TaxID=1447944 RepID=A0A6A4GR39_9AGAR|nr:hypothetical protein BT96DRAFT_475093 [Gymnopus androsaceus JB14]